MVDQNDLGEDITELHEAEGSLIRGWPSILMTIAVISAAIYAFSPRPYPSVPPTKIEADSLMTNGLAMQGGRYIAAGELGHILYADDANGPWQEAEIEPRRSATLTNVKFVDEDTAIAVGHSGWVLRSEDGGKSWQKLFFNEQSSDPLLGIAGPFEGDAAGKLFVFGAFGQLMVSTDGGRTWQSESLIIEKQEGAEADSGTEEESGQETGSVFGDASAEPGSEDYDPFADFEASGGMSDYSNQHIYDITEVADGSLFLVGERGMLLHSVNGGESWKPFEEIYDGSFYGALALPDGGVLVHGMRGNAFVTRDLGETWQKSKIPLVQGLYASEVSADGTIVVVGASNTVLVSHDGGETFRKATQRGPHALATVLSLSSNRWLLAGEGGVGRRSTLQPASAATGDRS